MNVDARNLRIALRDGPVSLGQLRRDREWQPEKLLKVVLLHPDQFSMTSVVLDRRQHPAIQAVSELEDDVKVFIAAVRTSGRMGITSIKLYRTYKIKTERSIHLAGEFPDLVTIEKRKSKIYYFWTPKLEKEPAASTKLAEFANLTQSAEPETDGNRTESAQERVSGSGQAVGKVEGSQAVLEAPSDPELLERRDKLIALTKDGIRNSKFLEEYGYDIPSLVELARAFPETFHAQVVQLSNDPSGAFLQIGLNRSVPKPEPESQPVEPTSSLQEPLTSVLSADEIKQASWKPATRGMGYRRNSPQGVRGGQVRPRRPVVEI